MNPALAFGLVIVAVALVFAYALGGTAERARYAWYAYRGSVRTFRRRRRIAGRRIGDLLGMLAIPCVLAAFVIAVLIVRK